jgi:cyclopropane-fatty-acyl-phospholipid synthase
MSQPAPITTSRPSQTAAPGWLDRLARAAVHVRLRGLRRGHLTLIEGSGNTAFGRPGEGTLRAAITIQDPNCYRDIAFGGSIGAGEAYMRGAWSCDDLTAVVRIFVANRNVLDGMETGLARLTEPLHRLFHRLRRNTKPGSCRNIEAHYDLGNEFFSLMLDETMMYSCAYFERASCTLAEASTAKNDRICRKLGLQPTDHLLEIGTGWGGFAIHAASRYGCRVTTTTISRQQHDLAVRRIAEAGLSDRITVLMQDYRDLRGLGVQFDKIVSIEMIEAVGHEFYDAYFACCSDLLKPDGRMLIQAITIDDRQYHRAARSVDFIQRFIFPGSCIPSVTALCQSIARASELRLFGLEDIGAHYPPTLRGWKTRLFANAARLRALGYSDQFLRMWEFYLCYCEGGFLERAISDVQMVLTKPLARAPG